jgi:hypothetical protein
MCTFVCTTQINGLAGLVRADGARQCAMYREIHTGKIQTVPCSPRHAQRLSAMCVPSLSCVNWAGTLQKVVALSCVYWTGTQRRPFLGRPGTSKLYRPLPCVSFAVCIRTAKIIWLVCRVHTHSKGPISVFCLFLFQPCISFFAKRTFYYSSNKNTIVPA